MTWEELKEKISGLADSYKTQQVMVAMKEGESIVFYELGALKIADNGDIVLVCDIDDDI